MKDAHDRELHNSEQKIGDEFVLEYRPYEPLDHKGEIHFELVIWATHKDRTLPFSECLKTEYLR